MARPKQFNPEEALDKATLLFWEKGFDGVSIQDLVDHMGIGKASLYGTFGSKSELKSQAMDRYIGRIEHFLLENLQQPGHAPAVIRDLLYKIVRNGGFGDEIKSCLITKAALLAEEGDSELQDRARAFMTLVEEAFHDLLVRGRTERDISPEKNPRALARYFVGQLQAISVIACSRPETLPDVVDVALTVFD